MRGSSQGKLPVYLNLPVLHRLRHGRVAQQEGAADREARVADKSCVYEVTKNRPWIHTDTHEKKHSRDLDIKTNKTNINSNEYLPWIGTNINFEYS